MTYCGLGIGVCTVLTHCGLGTGVCTVLTDGGLKCVSNIRVFAVWQAKLEDELPSETVSKVHLVDLAGR